MSQCPQSFKCNSKDHKYYGRNDYDAKDDDYDKKVFYGRPCFNLVYPISLVYPDGTTKSYTDKVSLKQDLKDWRFDNKYGKKRPKLQFPIKVKIDNEYESKIIASRYELKALKQGCISEIPSSYKNKKDWYKDWKKWTKDWKSWSKNWKDKDSKGWKDWGKNWKDKGN